MFGIKPKNTKPEQQKNWYADRYQYVVVQRNIWVVIALISLLAALVSAYSIAQLAPLKSVEPFVIQVDQRSGITQVVNPLTIKDFNGNEALNNYFMTLYIRAHETFGVSDIQNYNIIRVMSEFNIFNEYAKNVNPNNPESPKNTLAGAQRRVKIGNVILIDSKPDTDGVPRLRYQVHIQEDDVKPGGDIARSVNKLVTIAYKYAELELSTEDRYLNPLGFRVMEYRIDDDALNNK